MEKILLYYVFTPLSDPAVVRLWQLTLCENLGLKGRILISGHGLNGTVGGEISALKQYVKACKAYAPFKGMAFKWSDGGAEHFPKLSVKVRNEIVAFDAADELRVDESGVVGGGTHLTPRQLHELVKQRGEDIVFFDGRNSFEAAVGKFKNAIVPDIKTSRDFIREIEKPEYEALKNKPVVTYCTGGIRCEILSSLMKNRGFQEVYQLDGGVASYGQEYGDDGLWEGALYVFDDRVTTKFSDNAQDIGKCIHCQNSTSTYRNCETKSCNRLMLVCEPCQTKQRCPDCLEGAGV